MLRELLCTLLLSSPLAAQVPWVTPDEVGPDAEQALILTSDWGWNIPGDLPLVLSERTLGSHGSLVVSTFNDGAGGPVAWENVRIHGFDEEHSKWGIRAFDCWDWSLTKCGFDTIRQEHGAYLSALGEITFEDCTFDDIGGQAVQIVYAHPDDPWRKLETGLKDRRVWIRLTNSTVKSEWHTVRRSAITNTTRPMDGRAGFALSFFSMLDPFTGPIGHAVRVSNSYIHTSAPWTDPNGYERDCSGAIMAHRRRKVKIQGNYIEYLKGDRDVIQLWGCGDDTPRTLDVEITNNMIKASQNIDIRLATPDDSIKIRRNRGTAPVVVSTNPLNVWESSPQWDEGKVIYRGVISENWSHNWR